MSVGTLNIGLARLVKLTHIMERALKREVSSRNLLLLRLVQLLILLPLLLKPLLLQHLLVHLVHLLAGLLHALLLHLRKQVKKRNQGGKPTCVSDFGVLFFLVTGRESSLWKIFENYENKSLKKIFSPAGWCCHGQMLCLLVDALLGDLEQRPCMCDKWILLRVTNKKN